MHNLQTNKGVWIPLGGEEEGIRVLNYNSEAKEVTIASLGVTAVLKLREAEFNGGSWIKPLPTLEQEYGRPLTVKEEEREARMLVSDLLEIGMKERERQRESATNSRPSRESRQAGWKGAGCPPGRRQLIELPFDAPRVLSPVETELDPPILAFRLADLRIRQPLRRNKLINKRERFSAYSGFFPVRVTQAPPQRRIWISSNPALRP